MNLRTFVPCLLLITAGALSLRAAALVQDTEPAGNRRKHPGGNRPIEAAVERLPLSHLSGKATVAPSPLPEGVEELRFEDFYKMPVGPRGLEMSERLHALAGKQVRLVGYFVYEDWTTCACPDEAPVPAKKSRRPAAPAWMKHVTPGRAMLASVPTSVSLGHYGLGDELPPQTAFVQIASRFGEPVAFKPGTYAVMGTLELGNREEPDGRISYVRLAVQSDSQIERLAPIARQASN